MHSFDFKDCQLITFTKSKKKKKKFLIACTCRLSLFVIFSFISYGKPRTAASQQHSASRCWNLCGSHVCHLFLCGCSRYISADKIVEEKAVGR